MATKRKSNISRSYTTKDKRRVTVTKTGDKYVDGVKTGTVNKPGTRSVIGQNTGESRVVRLGGGSDAQYDENGLFQGKNADKANYSTVNKPKEVSLISSEMGKDYVRQADTAIADLSPITAQPEIPTSQQGSATTPGVTQPPTQTTPTQPESNDFLTYVNESTGQEQTLRGTAITDQNKKNLETQGYTLASADTSKVQETPEIQQAQREYDEATASVNSFMSRLETSLITDKELASEIRQIKSGYKARAEEERQINERRKVAMNTLGSRLGARYTGGTAGIFGSILSEEERQGLDRIEKYENDKQDAILAAKKAAKEQNFTVYTQLAAKAEKIQEKKAQELKDLKTAQAEQTKKLAEEKQQAEYDALIAEQLGAGVTDPLTLLQNLGGKVPYDQIAEIAKLIPESKPITLGKTDILVDPRTGKIIARGIGETGDGDGVGGSDVEAQYYADLITKGMMKIENVPEKLRSRVVMSLATQEPTMSKANEQAYGQANTAITAIDSVLNGIKEAGIIERTVLSKVPGSLARDLENSIETVQALIGFDALAQMRAASPTGGALGSITEKELRYLQSVQGSLDPLQSTATLKKNIESIRKSFARIRAINSVDTTPEEYKKQFPDATEDELNEIRARSTKKSVQDNAQMSNKDLFNTGTWSTSGTTTDGTDVFQLIGLEE